MYSNSTVFTLSIKGLFSHRQIYACSACSAKQGR